MNFLIPLLLIPAGFITGTADAVAGGGNLMIIAVLGLSSLPALQAVATMQIISLVQNATASIVFERKKLVNWKQALIFVPFAVLGSLLGAKLAVSIDPNQFSRIIGVFMLALLFPISKIKKKKLTIPQFFSKIFQKVNHKRPEVSQSNKQTVTLMLLTLVIGFYGGFHGGAVGSIMLLSFYLVGQAEIMSVAATTKIVNIAMALVASYVYLTQPNLISWGYAVPMMAGTILGSFFGVKWADRFGLKYVRLLMYAVIIAAAAKYIFFTG